MRRALEIDERSFGPDHPNVAITLDNLAELLKGTNRLAEAEPLMRRAVQILLRFTRATGHPHLTCQQFSPTTRGSSRRWDVARRIRAALRDMVSDVIFSD